MSFITLLKHSFGCYTRQDYLDAYNTGKIATAYDFLTKENELYGMNADDWCKNMYDFTMDYISQFGGMPEVEETEIEIVEDRDDYDED